jgi:hypothetical protein
LPIRKVGEELLHLGLLGLLKDDVLLEDLRVEGFAGLVSCSHGVLELHTQGHDVSEKLTRSLVCALP